MPKNPLIVFALADDERGVAGIQMLSTSPLARSGVIHTIMPEEHLELLRGLPHLPISKKTREEFPD